MTKYVDITPDDVERVMIRNRMKVNDDSVMDAYYALDFSVLNKCSVDLIDGNPDDEQREFLLAEIEIQLKDLKLII